MRMQREEREEEDEEEQEREEDEEEEEEEKDRSVALMPFRVGMTLSVGWGTWALPSLKRCS